MKNMVRFLILVGLIITSCLSYVNSSSGISSFSSNKAVAINIVDSNNALIAIPDVIQIKVKALKIINEYYDNAEYVEEESKKADETNEGIRSDKIEVIEKVKSELKPVTVEENIVIQKVTSNLTITNNMAEKIILTGITFDPSYIHANNNYQPISTGEIKSLNLGMYSGAMDPTTFNSLTTTANAALYFEWNNGTSILYKDVTIEYEVEIKRNKIYKGK